MGIKHDGAERHGVLRRMGARQCQQRLMTAMNTVEVSEREGAALPGGIQSGKAVNDVHAAFA